DRLAVRSRLRLSVAENTRAFRLEPVARGKNVLDLVADMMHAARRVLFQKGGDGRPLAQWLQQFDLGVVEHHEHDRHTVLRQRLRFRNLGAKRVAIDRSGRIEIRYGNRQMVEPFQHVFPYCVTNTVTIGFLPHTSLAEDRTERLTASATRSRLRRPLRGMLRIAPMAASSITSSISRPEASISATPIATRSGSPASSY